MLDEFEEMRVSYFFAPVEVLHVLLHLILQVEGENAQLQLIAFSLAPDPEFARRDGAYDVELLGDEVLRPAFLLSHRSFN